MTPLKHRQRPDVDGLGLSAVPGLVSGTPVPLHGSGRARQPLRELQHNPRANTETFTGVGLSSHLKTSQGLVGSLAPPVRPRGKPLPIPTVLLYTDRSSSCTTARCTNFRVDGTSRQWTRVSSRCLIRTAADLTCRIMELGADFCHTYNVIVILITSFVCASPSYRQQSIRIGSLCF